MLHIGPIISESIPCGVSISECLGRYLAVSELSPIVDIACVQKIYPAASGLWCYYSRLNVPEKYPDKSVCFRLLNATVEWADANQINILDDLNPYGRLNLPNLILLNKLYGFKQILPKTMIRLFRA